MLTAMLCWGGVALTCAALLPAAMNIAPVIGAVDVPGDDRRIHKKPTPRCGGMAMFVALWSVLGALGLTDRALLPLLLATALLLLLGIADDVFGLPAAPKLAVQAVAALMVTGEYARTPLGIAAGVLWLCLLTNAHNMIDGMDGLCGSTVAIECGAVALLLLARGDGVGMLLALGGVGCCLGYLPYNLHPARVFMGDEGALFLGFLVGWLTMRAYTVYQLPAMAGLLCLLPLADFGITVSRRFLQGKNPLHADRGHLHHRLLDGGLSPRKTVLFLLSISFVGAIGALLCGI